jgi:hypothetical protein
MRNQVTCRCIAYKFPHRVGGGKCDGSEWAKSYRHINGKGCKLCNCLNGYDECDVAAGIEDIKECEGYQSLLAMKSTEVHPVSIDDFLDHLYPYED